MHTANKLLRCFILCYFKEAHKTSVTCTGKMFSYGLPQIDNNNIMLVVWCNYNVMCAVVCKLHLHCI